MSEHHVTTVVGAPVHQVYTFFTHFNDFPKFMSFVKEVTYPDDQRSHWVVQVAGTHEWDAVNEDWLPDQQVGWRSTDGLKNSGRVKFTSLGTGRTQVDVYISYIPPAGVLGSIVDSFGMDSRFNEVLQHDLDQFAHMVEQAPAGALDPMQSHYLFHSKSAVAKNMVTERQEASMQQDPLMSSEALNTRKTTIMHEQEQTKQALRSQRSEQEQKQARLYQAAQEQNAALQQQRERDDVEKARLHEQEAQTPAIPHEPDPVFDTIGGRNASMDRSAFGDQDGRSERFPKYQEDPMSARLPNQEKEVTRTPVSEIEEESPWRSSMYRRNIQSPGGEIAPENIENRQEKEP